MSLIDSLMYPLVKDYTDNLDKYEQRASVYGAKLAFDQDGQGADGILSVAVRDDIKNSYGNATGVQIPVLDHDTVTIGSTISCTVVDDENTSQLVNLTFVTYAFGFTMTKHQHGQNYVKYEADFARKMKKYSIELAATIDAQCVTTLEANKNQVWTGGNSTDYGYTEVGDALQVPLADHDDIYNNMKAIMEFMDFYDETNVIHNPNHRPLVARLQNQGASNGTNDGFQFTGYKWYSSNRVVNGAGVKSTAYFVNDNSLAMENRNRPVCEAGDTSTDGTEWGTSLVPFTGLVMGTQYKSTCADRSTLNGGDGGQSTADLYEMFQFDTEVCYVTAYNSDIATRYSPIIKVEAMLT